MTSPYSVEKAGTRFYVLCTRHGVVTRLAGFPTKQDAVRDQQRREERNAVLLNRVKQVVNR